MSAVHFDILAGPTELARIRPLWREWATRAELSPFATPAFFDAWCSAYSASCTPFVVAGFRRRELVFILPLWHPSEDRGRWQSLGSLRADYTEAIAPAADPELGRAFWRWLARSAPCTIGKLPLLPADSLLGMTAPAAAARRGELAMRALTTFSTTGRLRYVATSAYHEHPYADRDRVRELGGRLGAYDTRRKVKALAALGGPVSYALLRERRAIAQILPAFFAMHVANFAGTGRTSQFESERDRAFYEALVAHPELEQVIAMDVVSTADRPAAIHLGFQQHGWIYYYKPSFDLELSRASPGRILLANLFARANEQTVHGVDLLKGTESYKTEWANRTRQTVTANLIQRSTGELARAARARVKG